MEVIMRLVLMTEKESLAYLARAVIHNYERKYARWRYAWAWRELNAMPAVVWC